MPLVYDENGIPRFEIEAALEIGEGETPAADVVTFDKVKKSASKPKADVRDKSKIFAGDPKPKPGTITIRRPNMEAAIKEQADLRKAEEETEHLGAVALTTQDGTRIPKDTVKIRRPPGFKPPHKGITIDAYAIPPEDMAKQIEDAVTQFTQFSPLDANVATDAEVEEIERQAAARSIGQWPLLMRLINRLRQAERRR